MAQPVIFIVGKDLLTNRGGHSSFVRAHARAAQRAGFEPHLFCVAPRSDTVPTDFGVLHRAASPFRLVSQMMVPAHAPLLGAAIERFLQGRAGPHLVHSFNLWGYVGVSLSHRLRRRRCQIVPLVSAYTTMQHELSGKLAGLTKAHGRRQRLRHQTELAWCQLALDRYERRTLTESRLVLINYDSVARICAARRAGFTPHIFCAAPRSRIVATDFGVVHCVASPFRPFRTLLLPGHGPLIARGRTLSTRVPAALPDSRF